MTWITENDVTLSNEKKDVPLPKKMTRITENDVIEKMMFLCLKNYMNHRKWHYAK